MITGVAASDILRLRQSGDFDEQWYLSEYPDVALTGIDPAEHFLWIGVRLGRQPSASKLGFVGETAQLAHPPEPDMDVVTTSSQAVKSIDSSIDPYIYETVSSKFDRDYYLTVNEDVANVGVDPVEHYILAGWLEGRDPSLTFSTRHYLDHNDDIAKAGVNPFYHFVVAGEAEGRSGRHSLGFRFDILSNLKPISQQIADSKYHRRSVQSSSPARLKQKFDEVSAWDEKVLLSFSHDNFSENVGGVQLLLRQELGLLRKQGVKQIHFFPAYPMSFVNVSHDNAPIGVLIDGEMIGYYTYDDVISCARFIAQKIEIEPKFVIHNLLGHNIDQVVKLIRSFGATSGFFWIHDYAALYNNYKLLRNDISYSGVPKPGTMAYELCEYTRADFSQPREFSKLFKAFEVNLISPSQAALDIWNEAGEHQSKTETVLSHCQLIPVATAPVAANTSGPLKVGFLGYPVDHKGWPVFQDLVMKFANDDRYKFYHLGKGRKGGLPVTYQEVIGDADNPDAMRAAVSAAGLDVALVWSMWPETFCLVAYEAIAGGAALVTNKAAGNVASVVKAMSVGEVVDDEVALVELFETGEILKFARRARSVQNYKMEYSNLTAEFLGASAT